MLCRVVRRSKEPLPSGRSAASLSERQPAASALLIDEGRSRLSAHATRSPNRRPRCFFLPICTQLTRVFNPASRAEIGHRKFIACRQAVRSARVGSGDH